MTYKKTGGSLASSASTATELSGYNLWAAENLEADSMLWVGGVVTVALALTILVFRHTAAAMLHTWIHDRSYSQGYIVLPISISLWTRRKKILAERPQPFFPGILLLALLALLWVAGNVGDILLVTEFALVAMLCAMVWTIAGTAVTRQLVFPLGFLFFAVPCGTELVPMLQEFTASFAAAALQLSGVPLVLENHMILVPSGSWEVAEACSGLRYLTASILMGVLLAGVVYRTWKRRIAFVALSVVVPIVANGIRAYGIVMLGYWSNNRLAAGVDHIVYGTVFFILISVGMIAFGIHWQDSEVEPRVIPAKPKKKLEGSAAKAIRRKVIAAAITGVIILGIAPLLAGRLWANPSTGLPLQVTVDPRWRLFLDYDWDWAPTIGSGATETMRAYQDGAGSAVEVYIGNYRDSQRSTVVINSYNVVRDPGAWVVVGDQRRLTSMGGRQVWVRQLKLQSSSSSRLVWLWYSVGDHSPARPLELKLLKAKYRILGGPKTAAVVAVSVRYESDTAQAAATLEKFLSGASFQRVR